MTILAAASALIDDLVDSGSFHRTQVSACDYGILDTSGAGCVVILQPGQSTFEMIGFGGPTWDMWGIVAECYIRMTGHSVPTLTKVWQIHDVIKACVAGSNVNTGARMAEVTGMNRPQNTFFEIGGHDFLPVFVNIKVSEDP